MTVLSIIIITFLSCKTAGIVYIPAKVGAESDDRLLQNKNMFTNLISYNQHVSYIVSGSRQGVP
jgi:hypothetical protein